MLRRVAALVALLSSGCYRYVTLRPDELSQLDTARRPTLQTIHRADGDIPLTPSLRVLIHCDAPGNEWVADAKLDEASVERARLRILDVDGVSRDVPLGERRLTVELGALDVDHTVAGAFIAGVVLLGGSLALLGYFVDHATQRDTSWTLPPF